jgi:hypothetical protein
VDSRVSGRGSRKKAQRMSSRTALVTWSVLLSCAGAGSCVLGNDSDRPVLQVDPIWDAAPGEGFLADTCQGAGVAAMTWEIQDAKGKELEKSEHPEECKPFDFVGLRPGTYQLVIEGYDKDMQKRWQETCPNLKLGRFDVLYPCEVDQIPGDGTDENPDDTDAGTPDAG